MQFRVEDEAKTRPGQYRAEARASRGQGEAESRARQGRGVAQVSAKRGRWDHKAWRGGGEAGQGDN